MAVVALAVVAVPQAHAAGVSGQGTWETTLQGRDLDGNVANGFEAYFDTALNITWLADANYAQTSGYDGDAFMNWGTANAWAASLNVSGTTGWRLPTLADTGSAGCNFAYSGTDCGYSVSTSTSELAHLFHVTLGNKSKFDASGNGLQNDWGLTNTGPFKNVQPYSYWSGVEYQPSTSGAWNFDFKVGFQGHNLKSTYAVAAWAVRSGDIAAVPEPSAFALFLIGMVGMLLARCVKPGA